jgi:hypothetical protein
MLIEKKTKQKSVFVGNRTLQVRSVRSINVNNNDPKLIKAVTVVIFRSKIKLMKLQSTEYYFYFLFRITRFNSCRHEENENNNNAIWIFFWNDFYPSPIHPPPNLKC